MIYEALTIKQVEEIKGLKDSCKTIGEWKTAMREKARELGISDQDILKANRS
jgi:hypothetical protein